MRFLPVGLVVAAATTLFLQTKNFGLLGFDTYPLIASSRVRSLADLLGYFTKELGTGYHQFYRPVAKLTFAADYGLWGLNPWGYQLTSILILGACAVAVHALAQRLGGAAARVGPWVTLLAFLFHPLLYDTVPIPSRRSELLCGGFIALSLWLQLSSRALRSRFPVWPAVATLLAVLSKETAFVLPAVTLLLVFLYSPLPDWRRRLVRAGTSILPHVVLLSLPLVSAVTTFAHGGWSLGSPRSKLDSTLPGVPDASWITLEAGHWVLITIVCSIVALFATTLRLGSGSGPRWSLPRAELVSIMLIVLVLVLVYLKGDPWKFEYQFFLPMVGASLLLGAVVERILPLWRDPRRMARVACVAMIGLLAVPVIRQARFSPLIFHYGEGERATAASRAFLEEARAQINAAPDGSVLEAPPLPRRVPPVDPLRTLGTTILLDYSVRAWAELTLPERRVRVVYRPTASETDLAPSPREVVLVISRRLEGY